MRAAYDRAGWEPERRRPDRVPRDRHAGRRRGRVRQPPGALGRVGRGRRAVRDRLGQVERRPRPDGGGRGGPAQGPARARARGPAADGRLRPPGAGPGPRCGARSASWPRPSPGRAGPRATPRRVGAQRVRVRRDQRPCPDRGVDARAPRTPARGVAEPPAPDEPIAIVGLAAHFGPFEGLRAFQERVLGGAIEGEPTGPRNWWGAERSDWFDREGYADRPTGLPDRRGRPADRPLPHPAERAGGDAPAAVAPAPAGGRGDRRRRVGRPDPPAVRVPGRARARPEHDQLPRPLVAARQGPRVGRPARAWACRTRRWPTGSDELRDAFGPPLSANRTMGALGSIVASRVAREFRLGGPSFTVSAEETSGLRALDVACRHAPPGRARRGDRRRGRPRRRPPRLARRGDAPPADGPGRRRGGRGPQAARRRRSRRRPGLCGRPGGRAWRPASDAASPRPAGPSTTRGRAAGVGYLDPAIERDRLIRLGPADPCASASARRRRPRRGGLGAGLAGQGGALPASADPAAAPGPRIPADRRPEARNTGSATGSTGPRRALVGGSGVDGNVAHVVLEGARAGGLRRLARPGPAARPPPLGAVRRRGGRRRRASLRGLDDLEALAPSRATVPSRPSPGDWWRSHPGDPARRLAASIVADGVADAPRRDRDGPPSGRRAGRPAEGPAGRSGGVSRPTRSGRARAWRSSSRAWGTTSPGWAASSRPTGRRSSGRRTRATTGSGARWPRGTYWNADPPAEFDDHRPSDLRPGLARDVRRRPAPVAGRPARRGDRLQPGRDDRPVRPRGLDRPRRDVPPVRRLDPVPVRPRRPLRRRPGRLGPRRRRAGRLGRRASSGARPRRSAQALEAIDRAYLLIVNTDRQVGRRRPGGRPSGGWSRPSAAGSTRCRWSAPCIARSSGAVERAYHDLHLLPTTPPPGRPVLQRARAASRTRSTASRPPTRSSPTPSTGSTSRRVVRRAYEDGVRAFVEVGPGGSCTRMIGEILEGRPHLAVAACPGEREPVAAFLAVLGPAGRRAVPGRPGVALRAGGRRPTGPTRPGRSGSRSAAGRSRSTPARSPGGRLEPDRRPVTTGSDRARRPLAGPIPRPRVPTRLPMPDFAAMPAPPRRLRPAPSARSSPPSRPGPGPTRRSSGPRAGSARRWPARSRSRWS